MKITALGHSAYMLDMGSSWDVRRVRILVDPWLSDYVVGDLMGRYPRIRPKLDYFQPLHGIWISHAHTDHLDPQSLLRLRRFYDPFPPLMIPAGLAHLVPLLEEYLHRPEIILMHEGEEIDLWGVTCTAFYNSTRDSSNEDDVMALHVYNGRQAALVESDAVLPYHDSEFRELLQVLLLGPEIEVAAVLTTKNELSATMSMLAATSREDRLERVSAAMAAVYQELWDFYGPAAENEEDLFREARLYRLIGGQGIAVPTKIDPELNRVLFPLNVPGRVRMEREVAAQCGCAHRVAVLVPGYRHELTPRGLQRHRAGYIQLLDKETDRAFDPTVERYADFPMAPLRDEERDREAQQARILAMLNDRFLPWFIGRRNPPLEQLIAAGGGEWRIRVRFGTTADFEDRDFRISYGQLRFEVAPPEGPPGEHCFANDVEDVLDGRADEFSTVCRAPLPASTQHFWQSLGMPWLCPDLVERKLRHHFERCASGRNNAGFVKPFWK